MTSTNLVHEFEDSATESEEEVAEALNNLSKGNNKKKRDHNDVDIKSAPYDWDELLKCYHSYRTLEIDGKTYIKNKAARGQKAKDVYRSKSIACRALDQMYNQHDISSFTVMMLPSGMTRIHCNGAMGEYVSNLMVLPTDGKPVNFVDHIEEQMARTAKDYIVPVRTIFKKNK